MKAWVWKVVGNFYADVATKRKPKVNEERAHYIFRTDQVPIRVCPDMLARLLGISPSEITEHPIRVEITGKVL